MEVNRVCLELVEGNDAHSAGAPQLGPELCFD